MQMHEYLCEWHNLKRKEFLMHIIESCVQRKVRGRNWSTLKWFGGKDFRTPLEDWERIIGQNVNAGSDQFKGKKQIIMYTGDENISSFVKFLDDLKNLFSKTEFSKMQIRI